MFLKPNKNLAETSNPIEYLICNTNLSSIGIGSINFRATYKRIEPTIGEFASYHDFYKLCVNENTFDIISFSQEFTEDQEIIARSVDDFLNFLLIYKEYDAFLIYDRETDISTLKGQLVVLESKGFSNGLVRDLIKL